MRNLLLFFFTLLSPVAEAESSTPIEVEAVAETTPLPFGTKESDDAAIWFHAKIPEKSLILGTSKVTPEANRVGGVGVYNLQGQEQAFLAGDKLNNIDIVYKKDHEEGASKAWAVASNRTAQGVDVYKIKKKGIVKKIATIPLFDATQSPIAPYGLCLAQRIKQQEVFVTTKSGVLYRYAVTLGDSPAATLLEEIHLDTIVSKADDDFLKMIVEKAAKAEGDLDKLQDKLAQRFAIEGCAYDPRHDRVFVGMENLGIWSVPLASKNQSRATLIQKISGSWTDIADWSHDPALPRITDDIEGMDVFSFGGRDYLVFSNQGISEFSLLDTESGRVLGNFKIRFGNDEVTETDGLTVLARPLSPELPEGVIVVHDDKNTTPEGRIENANYKIVSLKDVLRLIP